MGKYSSSRAQQAAIAMSKKTKAGRRGVPKKKKGDRGKFPGDVNRDGRVNGADFRLARKMGRLR